MIEITVQVDGEQQVLARIDRLTDVLREKLRVALPQLGTEVLDAAAARAPHKSGKLRRSLRARLRETRDVLSETVKPTDFVGRFQETGLDTMRRSPRERGIVGVRTRTTKTGTVLVSPRRGFLRRQGGAEHPFHLPAHPFMRPAFASLQERIIARLTEALGAAVGS